MSTESEAEVTDGYKDNPLATPCPRCSRTILRNSDRCRYCGVVFTEEEKAVLSPPNQLSPGCLGLTALLLMGLVLGAFSMVRGCSGVSSDTMTPEQEEFAWKEAAKEVVRAQLRDPESAEFSGLTVHPGGEDTATVICGYVNSRNGFGGVTGRQRFISGGTVILEEQVTAAQMQQAWVTFCM